MPPRAACPLLRNDYIFLRAFDYREQLLLLSTRNFELVETFFEFIPHRLPFALGDLEVLVRFFHGAPRVHLWTTGSLAHNRGHLKFKSRFWHTLPCFLDSRI